VLVGQGQMGKRRRVRGRRPHAVANWWFWRRARGSKCHR
jgi:hypothetical protein